MSYPKESIHTVNLTVLQGLAGNQAEVDEFTALFGDADHKGVATALQEALANERNKKNAESAQELIKVFRLSDADELANVQRIRDLRAQERAIKTRLTALGRAKAYGRETMNVLPLLSVLRNDTEHTVPANWKPKNAKPGK